MQRTPTPAKAGAKLAYRPRWADGSLSCGRYQMNKVNNQVLNFPLFVNGNPIVEISAT